MTPAITCLQPGYVHIMQSSSFTMLIQSNKAGQVLILHGFGQNHRNMRRKDFPPENHEFKWRVAGIQANGQRFIRACRTCNSEEPVSSHRGPPHWTSTLTTAGCGPLRLEMDANITGQAKVELKGMRLIHTISPIQNECTHYSRMCDIPERALRQSSSVCAAPGCALLTPLQNVQCSRVRATPELQSVRYSRTPDRKSVV